MRLTFNFIFPGRLIPDLIDTPQWLSLADTLGEIYGMSPYSVNWGLGGDPRNLLFSAFILYPGFGELLMDHL